MNWLTNYPVLEKLCSDRMNQIIYEVDKPDDIYLEMIS